MRVGRLMQGLLGSRSCYLALEFLFIDRDVGSAMVFFGSPDSPVSAEETARDVDDSAPGQLV